MDQEKTVLFVDDEVNILHSLERGLIDVEYQCAFVDSGYKALDYMEKHSVNVIVSDMRMPGMDGLTLLKKVKERWPHITRIVLTGYAQISQIVATVNHADIFQMMFKPWKMEEEFLPVIQAALQYNQMQLDKEFYEKALTEQNKLYQKLLQKMQQKTDLTKKTAAMKNRLLKEAFALLAAAEKTEEKTVLERCLSSYGALLQEIGATPLDAFADKETEAFLNECGELIAQLISGPVARRTENISGKDPLQIHYRLLYVVLKSALLPLLGGAQRAEVCLSRGVQSSGMRRLTVVLQKTAAPGDAYFCKNQLAPLGREIMSWLDGSFAYEFSAGRQLLHLEFPIQSDADGVY